MDNDYKLPNASREQAEQKKLEEPDFLPPPPLFPQAPYEPDYQNLGDLIVARRMLGYIGDEDQLAFAWPACRGVENL